MRRLREQFPNELVVIGVHSAKFPSEKLTENIRQAVMRHGIEHPVVNDAGFEIWNEYAVRAWPTLILIDPRQRVVGEISGEILAEELAVEIESLLKEHGSLVNRAPFAVQPEERLDLPQPLRFPARVLPAGERFFVADSGHHRVLEVALDPDGQAGELLRVFGNGQPGLRDGPPGEARFHQPHGFSLLGSPLDGTLYVADTENHAVRAIDLVSGVTRTVAGTGEKAHGQYESAHPTDTSLRSPWAVEAIENIVFIAMAGSHQIWVLIDENRLGPFAGNGREALVDGPAADSSFNQPSDLSYGFGHLFVADAEASAVRALTLYEAPRVLTLVGQGLFDFGDADGTGSQVRLQHPTGLDVSEADGLIYLADSYNHKIKTLDPRTGLVQTLIGSGQPGAADGSFETAELFEPEGLRVQDGLLYIADTNNHSIRIADIAGRQVTTLTTRGLSVPRLAQEDEPGEALLEEAAEAASLLREADRRFPPLRLAPGPARLRFEPRLPAGYHLHPEQESSAVLVPEPGIPITGAPLDPGLELDLDLSETGDIEVDVTLYYCRDGEGGLCLVDDRRWALRVELDPDAPSEAVIPVDVDVTGLP